MPSRSLRSASALIFWNSRLTSLTRRGELLVRDQREDGEAGAHLAGVEVDGADRPRGGQHLEHRGADGRRACVAGLQLVDAARQICGEPRLVDFKMLDDRGEVARSRIEQLGEVVLDLDIVVGAREAEAGRALRAPERAASFNLPIRAFRFSPIMSPLQSQNRVVRIAPQGRGFEP